MKKWNAESMELGHYVTGTYYYPPKDVWVEAIQITPENVGGLAIELEAELLWNQESGAHFKIMVWREPTNMLNGCDFTVLTFRAGFWIVPLRDEIHLYDDYSFENTFVDTSTLNSEAEPYNEKALREYAKKDAEATAKMYEVQPVANFTVGAEGQLHQVRPLEESNDNQIEHSIEMEPVDVANKKLFKTEDRVVHVATSQKGVVVNPMTEGGHVEVLMNSDGQTYVFHSNQLELIYPEIRTEKTED